MADTAHSHAHGHSHNHSGHDHHGHSHGTIQVLDKVNNAFYIGIGLNLAFVIVEAIVGLYIHSLSLLSDAGHNLADVASLALSLLAFGLMKVKPNEKYTYGLKKTTILVALFNAVVLLISIGAISYEAVHRFFKPVPLPGFTIAIIAGIGIVVNASSALLFFRQKDKEINSRAAYLHLMSDAVVSLGLVIGGVILHYTGWQWIDPVLGVIVAIVILTSTWSLLSSSFRMSVDGVPEDIDLQKVKEAIEKVKGVNEVHHMHVWSISSAQNALTAHVKVNGINTMAENEAIKHKLKHALEHQNIQHTTIEFEIGDEDCKAPDC